MLDQGAERDADAEIAQLRGLVARLEARCAELDRLAHYDSLVPLPNRRGFLRQLELFIARFQRYGDPAAVLFVDMDGLKALNDGHGHGAGDRALIQLASLLVNGVRQSDCVGRLGGDEFGIVLDRADHGSAGDTAQRLIRFVSDERFEIEGRCIPLSITVGLTMIEFDDTPEAVLARADRAMYEAKAAA